MKTLNVANHWNAELIDQQYDLWLKQPESLTPEWRAFFEGFELGKTPSISKKTAVSGASTQGSSLSVNLSKHV
jgi:2-oxoglutarate dehydrogenase complex dehydrogenase (E1) component-like enzyme